MNVARNLRLKVKGWLNEPIPRKQVLPAYLILTIGIVGGLVRFEQVTQDRVDQAAVESTERARLVEDFAVLTAYNLCVERVDTRAALRTVLLGITDQLEGDPASVKVLREIIEEGYPPTTVADECFSPHD